MLAKFATLVAASILRPSESYILKPSNVQYEHIHDVRTRSSTATGQRDSAIEEGKLAPQCECKSQSDAGDMIFGATLRDGSFGWCEYAPGVALECPHCCPDSATEEGKLALQHCECKSQGDAGDMIFGAATSDGSFGWCKYAPRIASECPHCCPPASPPQPPTAEPSESCANSAWSSQPNPRLSSPRKEANQLQEELDDDAADLAQAFEDEGLSETPLAHILLQKRAVAGGLTPPTKEHDTPGRVPTSQPHKVSDAVGLTSRQRVMISFMRKFLPAARRLLRWIHF